VDVFSVVETRAVSASTFGGDQRGARAGTRRETRGRIARAREGRAGTRKGTTRRVMDRMRETDETRVFFVM